MERPKTKDKFAIGATMFVFTEDEKRRAHETSVLMGCDAMRICMNLDPIHFPHNEVIQWMNSLRRDRADWMRVPVKDGAVMGQRAAAIQGGKEAPQETNVNQAAFGTVLAVGEPCIGKWIGPPDASLRQWSCICGAERPEQCKTETPEL